MANFKKYNYTSGKILKVLIATSKNTQVKTSHYKTNSPCSLKYHKSRTYQT